MTIIIALCRYMYIGSCTSILLLLLLLLWWIQEVICTHTHPLEPSFAIVAADRKPCIVQRSFYIMTKAFVPCNSFASLGLSLILRVCSHSQPFTSISQKFMYTTEAAWRLHSFSSLSLNRIIRFAHVFSDPADDDGRVIRALSEDERRDVSVLHFWTLLNYLFT